MDNSNMTYQIVYFSGTGGTRRAAEAHANADITTANSASSSPETLVLFFPVYSFNEPTPIAEWVERLPAVLSHQGKKQALVISISGGGEVPSNSACRSRVISRILRYYSQRG